MWRSKGRHFILVGFGKSEKCLEDEWLLITEHYFEKVRMLQVARTYIKVLVVF